MGYSEGNKSVPGVQLPGSQAQEPSCKRPVRWHMEREQELKQLQKWRGPGACLGKPEKPGLASPHKNELDTVIRDLGVGSSGGAVSQSSVGCPGQPGFQPRVSGRLVQPQDAHI